MHDLGDVYGTIHVYIYIIILELYAWFGRRIWNYTYI